MSENSWRAMRNLHESALGGIGYLFVQMFEKGAPNETFSCRFILKAKWLIYVNCYVINWFASKWLRSLMLIARPLTNILRSKQILEICLFPIPSLALLPIDALLSHVDVARS